MKTIVAVSTPVGAGAISIVRMSGKDCLQIASKVFCAKEKLSPRKLVLGKFHADGINEKCLAVYFKAPNSYTGEDIIEFQCHGGEILTQAVLKALLKNGATLAENGEFTKRAFLNGKLTLDNAEGIIDVINAGSEAELKAGYKLMAGELTGEVKKLQGYLTEEIANIDMALDYPEHDSEAETLLKTQNVLIEVAGKIKSLLASKGAVKLIKNGINIAIVGKPNVGKSSLLNALIGEERAIVTDIEGTTRDTITETIVYKDIKFNFIDTAGVRESDNLVERIGIERSKKALEQADITLLVLDGSKALSKEDKELLKLTENKKRIIIINKSDKKQIINFSQDAIEISALEKKNIEKVKQKIYDIFEGGKIDTSGLMLTNIRHIEALEKAEKICEQAILALSTQTADIASFLIKKLWNELGKITGETETESIIDAIFSKFCLGK